jgi:hypothetical protein
MELAQQRPILVSIQSAMAFKPSGFELNKTETETALLSCTFNLKKKKKSKGIILIELSMQTSLLHPFRHTNHL